MAPRILLIALAALAFTLLGSTSIALAQKGQCVDMCGVSCLKPFSIPDRWDDATGIGGYMGGGGRAVPDWRHNARWDHEVFVDDDGDGLYTPGESYVDGNGNGVFDSELYDPLRTGYGLSPIPLAPDGDLGLELVLHPGYPGNAPTPGQYLAIALPPINKGTPLVDGDDYRENIANCHATVVESGDWLQTHPGGMSGPTNQGMRDLIAQDPDAYWDETSQSVQNSNFPISPRIIGISVHDPRLPVLNDGVYALRVVKVAAFFMERMTGPAEVRGRFLRSIVPSTATTTPCGAGQVGGFFVECPVPAVSSSWGRVKATYR